MSGRGVNPRWSNGYRRRKEQARYRAMGANCYICLQPIDYSLRSPDPWSFVIDETVPIARGGRVCHSNSGPAHRWCNGIKGTHTLAWARERVRQLLDENDGMAPVKPTSMGFTSSDW